MDLYTDITSGMKEVELMWIPGDGAIGGNETPDNSAKGAALQSPTPSNDLKIS